MEFKSWVLLLGSLMTALLLECVEEKRKLEERVIQC